MDTHRDLSPDEVTLHLIATGVLALHRSTAYGEPLSIPYPKALQLGLNRLAIAALRRGATPAQGIPDLLARCHKPLREWPLKLDESLFASDDQLLQEGLPTGLCDAWACAVSDAEAELTEEHIMLGARRICQSAG